MNDTHSKTFGYGLKVAYRPGRSFTREEYYNYQELAHLSLIRPPGWYLHQFDASLYTALFTPVARLTDSMNHLTNIIHEDAKAHQESLALIEEFFDMEKFEADERIKLSQGVISDNGQEVDMLKESEHVDQEKVHREGEYDPMSGNAQLTRQEHIDQDTQSSLYEHLEQLVQFDHHNDIDQGISSRHGEYVKQNTQASRQEPVNHCTQSDHHEHGDREAQPSHAEYLAQEMQSNQHIQANEQKTLEQVNRTTKSPQFRHLYLDSNGSHSDSSELCHTQDNTGQHQSSNHNVEQHKSRQVDSLTNLSTLARSINTLYNFSDQTASEVQNSSIVTAGSSQGINTIPVIIQQQTRGTSLIAGKSQYPPDARVSLMTSSNHSAPIPFSSSAEQNYQAAKAHQLDSGHTQFQPDFMNFNTHHNAHSSACHEQQSLAQTEPSGDPTYKALRSTRDDALERALADLAHDNRGADMPIKEDVLINEQLISKARPNISATIDRALPNVDLEVSHPDKGTTPTDSLDTKTKKRPHSPEVLPRLTRARFDHTTDRLEQLAQRQNRRVVKIEDAADTLEDGEMSSLKADAVDDTTLTEQSQLQDDSEITDNMTTKKKKPQRKTALHSLIIDDPSYSGFDIRQQLEAKETPRRTRGQQHAVEKDSKPSRIAAAKVDRQKKK